MTDRAMQVWAALAEMFGQPLLTNYGGEPPPLWRAKIGELTDGQVANGLRVLSEKPTPYPPSLGEFVAACRGGGSPRMLGQDLGDADVRRLTGPAPAARAGLPPGMSAIAYQAAENAVAGLAPYIDGHYTCASSLPAKHHAAYLAGAFANAAQHREYLRAHPGYAQRIEREFAERWKLDVKLADVMGAWPP
jgi:hypothetical protein